MSLLSSEEELYRLEVEAVSNWESWKALTSHTDENCKCIGLSRGIVVPSKPWPALVADKSDPISFE